MTRTSRPVFPVLGSLLGAAALAYSSLAARTIAPQILPASSSPPQARTASQKVARSAYWFSRRGLAFGVPDQAYAAAVAAMRGMQERQRRAAAGKDSSSAAGFSWRFIGPEPITNELGNFFTVAPGQGSRFDAAGRVTAIAADPIASRRVFIGAANGGVWMSTDGGVTFVPIGDSLPTQAVGAIALDPTTKPPTLYVGTGEANNGIDSYYGQGVFKSTDLGAHWSGSSAGTFDAVSIGKIALDPAAMPVPIFVAASGGFSGGRAGARLSASDPHKLGLWRSTDGGASWIHYGVDVPDPFGCSPAPGVFCAASDVEIDSFSGNVYAAIQGGGVFVSTDGGTSYKAACLGGGSPCTFPSGPNQVDRISIATGPPVSGAPNACLGGTTSCGVVYVIAGSQDGSTYGGMFSSTDGGTTWSASTVPCATAFQRTIDGTADTSGSCGNPAVFSQELFDQAMLVSSGDPGTVLFGGIGVYLSQDNASTWSFLAQSGPLGVQFSPPSLSGPPQGNTHSDQHALAISSDGDTVYLGNDGGAFIFSLSAATTSPPPFRPLNDTLPISQVQTIAPHPTDDSKVLAGLQDNGTNLFTGGLAWNQVETGDGGFVAFDRRKPNFAYHTFSVPQGTTVTGGVSANGGIAWTHFAVSFRKPERGFAFYPPLAADPSVARRVLIGGHFVWAFNFANKRVVRQSNQDLTAGCGDGSCALQDIEFAPSDHRRAWALSMSNSGGAPFKLFNTTQADRNSGARWTDVTKRLGFDTSKSQATGIALDTNNANAAYLSVSGFTAATGIGHIFKTMDFGATWKRADGAGGSSPLPDVPVLRVLVDRSDRRGSTVYAATDIGVFASTDGGGTWSAFNLNTIPVVPIFDIEQNANGVVFVATHGRGVYQLIRPAS